MRTRVTVTVGSMEAEAVELDEWEGDSTLISMLEEIPISPADISFEGPARRLVELVGMGEVAVDRVEGVETVYDPVAVY